MRIDLIAMAVTTFAVYWVWMRWGFARPEQAPVKMRVLEISAFASAFLHLGELAVAPLSRFTDLCSFALYGLAISLFLWAAITTRGTGIAFAFSKHPAKAQIVSGPYRWVRHPFYLAYAITWVAGTIACRSPLLLGTVVAMLSLYIDAAVREEQQLLAGPLRSEYLVYKANVGIFGPILPNRWFRKREA